MRETWYSHIYDEINSYNSTSETKSALKKVLYYCLNNKISNVTQIDLNNIKNINPNEIIAWQIHVSPLLKKENLIDKSSTEQFNFTNEGVNWYCYITNKKKDFMRENDKHIKNITNNNYDKCIINNESNINAPQSIKPSIENIEEKGTFVKSATAIITSIIAAVIAAYIIHILKF